MPFDGLLNDVLKTKDELEMLRELISVFKQYGMETKKLEDLIDTAIYELEDADRRKSTATIVNGVLYEKCKNYLPKAIDSINKEFYSLLTYVDISFVPVVPEETSIEKLYSLVEKDTRFVKELSEFLEITPSLDISFTFVNDFLEKYKDVTNDFEKKIGVLNENKLVSALSFGYNQVRKDTIEKVISIGFQKTANLSLGSGHAISVNEFIKLVERDNNVFSAFGYSTLNGLLNFLKKTNELVATLEDNEAFIYFISSFGGAYLNKRKEINVIDRISNDEFDGIFENLSKDMTGFFNDLLNLSKREERLSIAHRYIFSKYGKTFYEIVRDIYEKPLDNESKLSDLIDVFNYEDFPEMVYLTARYLTYASLYKKEASEEIRNFASMFVSDSLVRNFHKLSGKHQSVKDEDYKHIYSMATAEVIANELFYAKNVVDSETLVGGIILLENIAKYTPVDEIRFDYLPTLIKVSMGEIKEKKKELVDELIKKKDENVLDLIPDKYRLLVEKYLGG
ncbi:MAG: hypothetical protein J7K22_01135 [Nanoarchaeota archaeon]|nr:hypothetical protein [Nanoarchaeota archaeon]